MVEQIVRHLKGLGSDELVALWNEYASDQNMDLFIFYSLEDIATDYFAGEDPLGMARAVYFGNVQNWHDDYFAINANGNIVSFNSVFDDRCPISFNVLALWIIETNHDILQELLEDE